LQSNTRVASSGCCLLLRFILLLIYQKDCSASGRGFRSVKAPITYAPRMIPGSSSRVPSVGGAAAAFCVGALSECKD